jgi:hypothetical protein
MSDYIAPGATYTSRVALGAALTGLVGTVRFRLLDNDTTVDDPVYGPSIADIIEDPTGTGSYLFTGTAPNTAGRYSRVWDQGEGTDLIYDDDLIVNRSGAPITTPGSAYADHDDVYARAGRVAAAFQLDDAVVDEDAIDGFLGDCAAEIDAALAGRGFDPSALSSAAQAALLDLNAYGALARALTALVPGSRGSNVADLLALAEKIWDDGISTLRDGTHTVIAMLDAEGGGPTAGCLWTEEPTYGSQAGLAAEELALYDTNLKVGFRREEVL